jgi:hypothetical protein
MKEPHPSAMEVAGLVLTAIGTGVGLWTGFLQTLAWWRAGKPKYTAKLEVPGGHVVIENLSYDEMMALRAEHGQDGMVRVLLSDG